MEPDAVGRLSCNPAMGGLGKSHLVKEMDALGGIMGFCSDLAGIQFKTLNKTKGRAVWANRIQLDKKTYPKHTSKIRILHARNHKQQGQKQIRRSISIKWKHIFTKKYTANTFKRPRN